jgi:hypothetical protein
MTVRLQTAEGGIKKYETVYGVGGGEYDPPKYYVASCGRIWKGMPSEQEECDHLECAIYLAQQQNEHDPKGGRLGFRRGMKIMIIMNIMFTIIFYTDMPGILLITGLYTLMAIALLIGDHRAEMRLNELTEYRDNGTINGIRAWRFFDD